MATTPPPPSTRVDLRAALRELPLFPLPQAVLFPGALMPLHVFEPRYRKMMKDVLETHRVMAVAHLLTQGEARGEAIEGQPAIARVAGIGYVIEATELPDGRYNIVLEGRGRVHLSELPFVPPYRRARAELLEDKHADVPEVDQQSLLAVANAFSGYVQARDPSFHLVLPPSLPAARLADLCAHHLILDATERQTLLECLDPATRVRMVADALAVQFAALKREGRKTLN